MDELSDSSRQLIASLRTDRSPLGRVFRRSEGWNMRRGWYDQDWGRLEPRELAQYVGPSEPGSTVLEVASMHPSGFVREEAIKRLNLRDDGTELPYLLLRVNDWVLPVRKWALDAVSRRVAIKNADAFIASFALVARLVTLKRGDHSPLLSQIIGLLSGQVSLASALRLLNSESRTVRRSCFRLLCGNSPHSQAEIVKAGLSGSDPVIRYWAASAAPDAFMGDELQGLLMRLCGDPSAPVRRSALSMLVNKFPDVARGELSSALMDRNASVRSLARFHLNDRDREWFRSFYLKALSSVSPSDLPMAIAGLAETGAEADAEILAPFLANERARIRRAAVRCLIRLGGEGYVELVFRCVMDSFPGVSNEARGAASRFVNSIGGNRIWSEFNSQHAMHVRRNLLRLFAALPKWEALSRLLSACTDREASIVDLALQLLERWNARFNKNQLAPGLDELASAQAALSKASSSIPSKTAEDIRFVMRSFEVS